MKTVTVNVYIAEILGALCGSSLYSITKVVFVSFQTILFHLFNLLQLSVTCDCLVIMGTFSRDFNLLHLTCLTF